MKHLGRVLVIAMLWGFILTPSTVFAANYEDWWWNPSLSGQGVNIGHLGNTIFASWYTYDQTGAGMWLTMGATLIGNTATGGLVRTTGPALGMPFDPNQVTRTFIGQATFTFTDPNHAILSYTVYGISGSIALTRFTFNTISIDGLYLGGSIDQLSGCLDPSNNGSMVYGAEYSVTTSGSSIVIQEIVSEGICTASGQYAQNGSKFSAQGTFTCTNGAAGTWSTNDITVTEDAFVAKVTTHYTALETCYGVGTFGGLKVQ